MGETLVGLAQLGAIGLIALFLFLAYKVATPLLTAWVTRKTNAPPEQQKQQYEYNQQLATLVYDNSKSMSEVATATKQTIEILKEVAKDQQELLKVMRSHAEKAEQFYDTYSKSILRKFENLDVSD